MKKIFVKKLNKNKKEEIWIMSMKLGNILGCHQMAERSFFFKEYQLPVCARCCGVVLGYITFFMTYKIDMLTVAQSVFFCSIMFTDWFIQYIKVLQSNNTRRLITGIIGGYGFISLVTLFILSIIRSI